MYMSNGGDFIHMSDYILTSEIAGSILLTSCFFSCTLKRIVQFFLQAWIYQDECDQSYITVMESQQMH